MRDPVDTPPRRLRSDRIDALKFFAIALVLLSHVIAMPRYGSSLDVLYYIIPTFNMPLFMFLAGFVLFGREGDSPRRFLGRKFMALMVPYFAWLLLYLMRVQPLAAWPRLLGLATVNPHDPNRLWFLYVLFVFYVLFTLVRLVSKRDIALVGLALATVGIAALPHYDYFGRLNVQWLFVFFVAGYLLAKHRGRMPDVRPWMLGAVFAVFAVLLVLGRPGVGSEGWPPWYLLQSGEFMASMPQAASLTFMAWRFATAFAGIGVTVAMYSLLDARWWRWQAPLGRRSLGIYVTHPVFLTLATGTTTVALIGSWILILYVSLACAVLLEKTAFTRVVFLGLPAHARHS